MSEKENGKMNKVAFCPTMGVFMERLDDMSDIEQVPVGSAGQALVLLRTGQVEGVIIGRYAKAMELPNNAKFVKLMGGRTLVYLQKMGVPVEALKDVDVLTYLKPEEIADISGLFRHVEHLESLDDCLRYGLKIPVIIDWNDYRDDFELLIPVNERGDKVLDFRAPVLYHTGIPQETVSEIEKRIGEKS